MREREKRRERERERPESFVDETLNCARTHFDENQLCRPLVVEIHTEIAELKKERREERKRERGERKRERGISGNEKDEKKLNS